MRARIVAILALLLTAALLTTTGCAASPSASPPRTAESAASAPKSAAAPAAPAPAAVSRPASGGANQPADQAQQNLPSLDRMIVRTVTMTIAVPNVQEAYNKVEALAAAQRGYLSGTRIRQEGDRTVADVTLRVPADPATYQATLDQLRALADRVIDEQSQAQDVTEEYVDLESRMRNLQATEQSLLALLGKATKVEDIINVQRELTNVRGQIEQIQGRKQALERRADMATITLTIRESATFTRPGWSAGSTFERAVNALGSALRVLAEFGIYALVFAPIWGGMLLLLWAFIMGIRWLSRRTARNWPPRPPVGPGGPAGPPA
ncbi:MAG: DUF4349 domain-containing protein [Chloroflexi bacterium]|nr:DUF4349 domain-containing protein [Chloroflexota bacterium]